MLATTQPIPQYFDLDGSPLDAGYLYFGIENQNPETSPVTVYWDAAGTIPAAQPVRTLNGYAMRAGSPAIVYASGRYSFTARNAGRELVLSARSSYEFSGMAQIIEDIASTSVGKGASIVGAQDGAAGARFTHVQGAINDLLTGVAGVAVNVAAYPYLAKCDGMTDDTAAVNAAVLYLASQGGGRLMWPTGKTCKVLGKVWVVSNVQYDINGSRLVGGGATVGVMFETGYVSAGVLVTNVGTAYQSHIIKNAKIGGGVIENVGQAFNFQNANQGCKIHDLEVFNARQFGAFDACFNIKIDTVMHSGSTVNTTPSFDFKSANNAIVLNKVVTVSEWSYHFRGGGAGITMTGCTQEGGTKGIKVTGELLGLDLQGNYVEALPGTWLDLTDATYITFRIGSSYFNYVDVIFDDGGNCLVNGEWDGSNDIVNIGGQIDGVGFVYRGLMRVSSRLNFAKFALRNNNNSVTTVPENWLFSANSNIVNYSTWLGTSVTDFRKKAQVEQGLIPIRFSGDVGASYNGAVPFCTVTLGATTTIDTEIKWQPLSLFAKFALRASDGNGLHDLYGDIYGTVFKRHDADAMNMTISDNAGFLRISLTQTAPPFLSVTGTVQICS